MNDELKHLSEHLFGSSIFDPNRVVKVTCGKCGNVIDTCSHIDTIKTLIKNIELLKVWVRRFGKITALFTKKFRDDIGYDSDMKEFFDLCVSALDKMYLESEINDALDDGDVSNEGNSNG